MRTGEIEANLVLLNEVANLPYIPELVARKVQGTEKGRLEQADLEFHEREYRRLTAQLEAAYQGSRLPDQAMAAEAMNDLLVRVRLDGERNTQ